MTNLNMISSPSVIASVAFYFAIVGSSYVSGFSVANLKTNTRQHKCSSIELRYRSLHHGPDIEPASEEESYEYTKMSKDKIDRFGPGDFDQFGDFPADQFDGGDSEMGLSGDGTMGLQKLGRDVSPHLARTLAAKIYSEEIDQGAAYNEMSYADELMQANPTMDAVRAQQYESWAMQNEISSANRYMNEKTQSSHSSYVDDTYNYDTMVRRDIRSRNTKIHFLGTFLMTAFVFFLNQFQFVFCRMKLHFLLRLKLEKNLKA